MSHFSYSIRSSFYRTVLATPILLSLGNSAQAQSVRCGELDAEDRLISNEILRILKDNPGTNIALGLCVAASGSVYEEKQDAVAAGITFAGCAIIACGFAGLDNCQQVGSKWLALALRQIEIKRQRSTYGCPQ